MTQILLYSSKNGIALATDSRAVLFDSGMEESTGQVEIQKLFPLSRNVLIVTGGAGFGILLCRRFQRIVSQAGYSEFDEICDLAKGFFPPEVESFRKKSSGSILSEFDRVYFLTAACTASGGSEGPFRFILLASENGNDPVHVMETPRVLAIPRQIGIERRLANLLAREASLDEVETLFEGSLQKLADLDDDVGPPFHFARITTSGISVRTANA
jgi:hypothetical protein